MLPIVMDLALFELRDDERDYRYSQNCLKWLLEALVNSNREYLRLYPSTPTIFNSGVQYAREEGTEDWAGIRQILKRKRGDCEDLAAWRVAELRERHNEPARPLLKFKRVDGAWHYHIQVLRYAKSGGDWRKAHTEDPSRILGMGWDEGKPLAGTRLISTGA